MLNFFNKNKSGSGLVGLSISAENITLAHVIQTNDKPKLLLCKDFPIPNFEEKASILAEQVSKLGLENNNASYVLSPDEYKLLLVEAPDVGANEIALNCRNFLEGSNSFHIINHRQEICFRKFVAIPS